MRARIGLSGSLALLEPPEIRVTGGAPDQMAGRNELRVSYRQALVEAGNLHLRA